MAEAIGAEAYIAYAPIHTFIRYPDHDNLFPEEWVNVEMTSHQLTPEFWYIESFEINETALNNKVYMHPLTDRETVASQLADLALGYALKYGHYDDFTLLCSLKSLEYYPQKHNTHITKGRSLETTLIKYIENKGNIADDYVLLLGQKLDEIYADLINLGWERLGSDYFERLDRRNEEAQLLLHYQKELQ